MSVEGRNKWGFFAGTLAIIYSPFVIVMGFTQEKWHWVALGGASLVLLLIQDFRRYIQIAKASPGALVAVAASVGVMIVNGVIPVVVSVWDVRLSGLVFLSSVLTLIISVYLHKADARINGAAGPGGSIDR